MTLTALRHGLKQQVDVCSINPNSMIIGELQHVQCRTHHCADATEDNPLHGLHDVGGRGYRCEVVAKMTAIQLCKDKEYSKCCSCPTILDCSLLV